MKKHGTGSNLTNTNTNTNARPASTSSAQPAKSNIKPAVKHPANQTNSAPKSSNTKTTNGATSNTPNRKPVNGSNGTKKVVRRKRKKLISVFTIVLAVWLIAITCVIYWFYGKANAYMVHYEDVYQSSMPNLVAEDVFEHFKAYDVDYIWNNMSETPRISKFETSDTVKEYIGNMINGKTMEYKPSNKYSDSIPTYVVEADGFVVAEFSLCKDLQNPKEFGFPTWQLKEINYYTEPFETVNISAPVNFNVYVNDVLLDDTYVCSDEVKPSDESYLMEYDVMPGIHDFYVADFYIEPSVKITDMYGNEVPVSYDETKDLYSTGYTNQHPEKEELEEFAYNYTITFANVISHDDNLENLKPYFPENSQLYDSISRNTALKYFMSHSDTTIENKEIKEFTVYSENVVFIEVYIEQHMTVGWEDIEVIPTTARLYCVRIDGEWKVVSMRF